ncbi:hypothetical protein [Tissierella praeacuta]
MFLLQKQALKVIAGVDDIQSMDWRYEGIVGKARSCREDRICS